MKRHIKNISDLSLRQQAHDVAATSEVQRLMDFEQFMLTTRLRGIHAILAFQLRPTKGPVRSPGGNPSHPDISDIVQADNPDIPPTSSEPTHSWGNRLGFSY